MSNSQHRPSSSRENRAKAAQHKASYHRDLRAQDKLACLATDDDRPSDVQPPHLVAFNFDPVNFDATCAVDEDEFLHESVNMGSTFFVADALNVALAAHIH